MIGEVFQSNRDGAAVVEKYENCRKVTIKWALTGNTSVVQLNALKMGYVRDTGAIAARKQEAKERSRAHAEKLATAVLKRHAQQAAVAESKANAEQKRLLKRASQEAAKAQRAAAKVIREAKALATCDLSAIEIDESKPRKGVIEIDFKDRNGKWVLRFGNSSKRNFTQTRLGKLHNNVSQRARSGGSVQDVHGSSYKGVGISERFADPQRFCDWVVKQPGWGLGWQLDKDLLSGDNRQYSEDNCVFLPRRLNTAIAVCKDEKAVRRLAEAYKSILDPRAYAALSVWVPK